MVGMRDLIVALILIIVAGVVLSSFLSLMITQTRIVELPPIKPIIAPKAVTLGRVAMKVPAVDNKGNGVITVLRVEARPGEGRVLTNIDQLLFWVDTQYSIRVAKQVASNLTMVDLSGIDLVYDIETNASIIEGESAGAALTIATIAALENRTLNPDVIITGTIGPDGSIGPVGAILEKGRAARESGAALYLVPPGQGFQISYEPIRHCEQIGPITFCTTRYETEKINIKEEIGIDVQEVSNIQEALNYFLG
jgi:uncharacterized protein